LTPHPIVPSVQALRLSATARSRTSVGAITNLMSVDAQKLHDLVVFIHTVWDVPLMVTVCVVLLWQTVGPAALAALAVLTALLPLNAVFVGGMIRKLQVGRPTQLVSRCIYLLSNTLIMNKVILFVHG